MSHRLAAILALTATAVAVTACNDDNDSTAPQQTASVQFVNASGQSLDFLQNNQFLTSGQNVGFGAASSCATNVSTSSPNLLVRNTGSSTNIAGFSPNFIGGGRYTVVVTGTPGNLQFTTLQNTYPSLSSSQAGLRIINTSGLTGGYDVFVTAPGAALPATSNASNVTTGNSSNFFVIPSGTQQIRFTTTGSQTVTLSPDNMTLTAGRNYVGVLAAPLAGQTTPRFFLTQLCQ